MTWVQSSACSEEHFLSKLRVLNDENVLRIRMISTKQGIRDP